MPLRCNRVAVTVKWHRDYTVTATPFGYYRKKMWSESRRRCCRDPFFRSKSTRFQVLNFGNNILHFILLTLCMTRTGGTLFHLLCRGGPCARPQPEWPSATRMVVRNPNGRPQPIWKHRQILCHSGCGRPQGPHPAKQQEACFLRIIKGCDDFWHNTCSLLNK